MSSLRPKISNVDFNDAQFFKILNNEEYYEAN